MSQTRHHGPPDPPSSVKGAIVQSMSSYADRLLQELKERGKETKLAVFERLDAVMLMEQQWFCEAAQIHRRIEQKQTDLVLFEKIGRKPERRT